MKKATPVVHVGIVAYENAEALTVCLRSVRSQSYRNITITVLDNSHSDHVSRMLSHSFPQVRYFRMAYNCGYGIGHNMIIRGLQANLHDYYLSLNHDALLGHQYIERLVSGLKRSSADWGTGKISILSGPGAKTTSLYSVGHAMTANAYFFNIGNGHGSDAYRQSFEIFGAPGAAALYSFKLIRAISCEDAFFDPSFFMYSEDTDVDWRAQNAGLHCWYIADALASHRGGPRPSWIKPYAIAHRYLSAIKNATGRQLGYILPFLFVHFLVRLVLTPKQGAYMFYLFIGRLHGAVIFRMKHSVRPIDSWLSWSSMQITRQPVSLQSRLSHFFRDYAAS